MGWRTCFFILLLCVGMYFLSLKGLAVSKSILAVLFVFRPGKDADKAVLDACTGWVRHAGRFRESGTYEFILDCQLSKGNAEVLLLDRRKRQLLKLDRDSPVGRAEIERTGRYYLRWEFKNATGKCELRW